jgi:hypothetical protein
MNYVVHVPVYVLYTYISFIQIRRVVNFFAVFNERRFFFNRPDVYFEVPKLLIFLHWKIE